jgi:hypothetical protein
MIEGIEGKLLYVFFNPEKKLLQTVDHPLDKEAAMKNEHWEYLGDINVSDSLANGAICKSNDEDGD